MYQTEYAETETVKRVVAILNEQITSMEADGEEDLPHSFSSNEFKKSGALCYMLLFMSSYIQDIHDPRCDTFWTYFSHIQENYTEMDDNTITVVRTSNEARKKDDTLYNLRKWFNIVVARVSENNKCAATSLLMKKPKVGIGGKL